MAWGGTAVRVVEELWLTQFGGGSPWELLGMLLGGVAGWLLRNGGIPRFVAVLAGLACVWGCSAILNQPRPPGPSDELTGWGHGMYLLSWACVCVGAWVSLLFFIRWIPRKTPGNSA